MNDDLMKNPPNWGNDSLSSFINNFQENIHASFHNLKSEYGLLTEIDSTFLKLIENLNHSKEWFVVLFVIRAHSAYRMSASLALAGSATETFVLLRSIIENALYGFYLSNNIPSQEIWLQRHSDQQSMKKMKSEFTIAKMFEALSKIDNRQHQVAKMLYERTIDFGGHPNERAFTQNLSIDETENNINFEMVYLHGLTSSHLHSLKSLAQIGTCALSIFRLIFQHRFDIIGLTSELDHFQARL